MADSASGVTGDNSDTEKISPMDVDSPSAIKIENEMTSKEATTSVKANTKSEDIAVIEEDDGGEGESFNTPEPTNTATTPTPGDEKTEDDAEILLVNPLFGAKDVPVIDIESTPTSSDDDSEDEDFSEDVNVNNFQPISGNVGEGENGMLATDGDGNTLEGSGDGTSQPRLNGEGCNFECYQEKGILVGEIERLRRAVFELSERHSILEDFIEVEYSEKFDKFLKNREHLVSMGFGGKDSEGSQNIIDGKRSSKSAELIELLKMIKEQSNVKEEPESSSATFKKPSSSTKGASNSSNQPNKSQKAKPIPSISSHKERGSGRGGALSYNQRPALVPNAYAMNIQYQQQLIAQQRAQEAQARQYYAMYGHGGGMDSRDYVTAVSRTELYPSSSSRSYGQQGYGGRSDGNSDNKESKKKRKRKRQSEQSSEASAATAGSSKNIPKSSSKQDAADDDDVEVFDYNQALNPSTKRICPLCEKIMNRKSLRDHLSIVHQGHKVACPVCQVEFMQRKRIKTHMRDAHDLPVSEYSAYLDKIYNNIDEQCGPWLDKLMKEAETPTKDQLLVHNAEIQLTLLARREAKAEGNTQSTGEGGSTSTKAAAKPTPTTSRSSVPSSSSRAGHSSSSGGGGNNSRRDRDRRDRDRGGSRGGSSSYSSSHSQPVRIFTGANPKASAASKGYGGREPASADLYGPGGYAQYAARYLQQRAATGAGGVNRIYTPF